MKLKFLNRNKTGSLGLVLLLAPLSQFHSIALVEAANRGPETFPHVVGDKLSFSTTGALSYSKKLKATDLDTVIQCVEFNYQPDNTHNLWCTAQRISGAQNEIQQDYVEFAIENYSSEIKEYTLDFALRRNRGSAEYRSPGGWVSLTKYKNNEEGIAKVYAGSLFPRSSPSSCVIRIVKTEKVYEGNFYCTNLTESTYMRDQIGLSGQFRITEQSAVEM